MVVVAVVFGGCSCTSQSDRERGKRPDSETASQLMAKCVFQRSCTMKMFREGDKNSVSFKRARSEDKRD